MPRIGRCHTHLPGALAHVIVRFVDGRFVLDDPARDRYLALLASALSASDWRLISYALMSSHVHLGCLMGETELRTWALPMHIRFAQWINRRSAADNPKVLGHVIADRPSTKTMCPSRARFLIAYHHRNPMEAGVIGDPADSSWTSHRAYLGLAPNRGGLDLSLGFELAGFEPTPAGRRELHEFVSRTEVGVGELVTPDRAPVPVVRPPRRSPEEVVRAVASQLELPLTKLFGRSRERDLVLARRVALLAWLDLGRPIGEMAVALGISASAASRLLSRPHDAELVRAVAARVASALGGNGHETVAESQLVKLASP